MNDFAAALLDPGTPPPRGLRTWNGSDPGPRFDVYRNNVVVSLTDALADGFPVVRELVGGPFFATLARHFMRAHPPRSPVLTDWGDDFAGFVERYAPAATLPYLADVARLERARVRTCHAEDRPPLQPEHLAARLADPDALAASRPRLHPSLTVLRSRFAIVSLWAAHQGDGELEAVDPSVPEAALVLREGDEVIVLQVGDGAALLAGRLAAGATFADAVADAAAGDPSFEPAAALGLLIRHGVFVAWPTPGRDA